MIHDPVHNLPLEVPTEDGDLRFEPVPNKAQDGPAAMGSVGQ